MRMLIVVVLLLSHSLMAQDALIRRGLAIDQKFGEVGKQIQVVSAGNHGSMIVLPRGDEFRLPKNFWITDALYNTDKKALVTLVKTSRDDSLGYWSYGCLHVQENDGVYTIRLSMLNYHSDSSGIRRWLYGIDDVSGYPSVNFSVASSPAQGGKVTRRNEWWNVITEELVK